MHAWNFRTPGLIAFGEGKVARIGALVKGRTSGKVLLVTGPVLLRISVVEPVLQSLRKAGVPFALYAETSGEPTSRHADEALALFRREDCAALVACGGGGPMDLAKAVSLLHANNGDPRDYAARTRPPGPDRRSSPCPPSPVWAVKFPATGKTAHRLPDAGAGSRDPRPAADPQHAAVAHGGHRYGRPDPRH